MPRTCWTKADLDLRYSESDRGSRPQCQGHVGQKLTLTYITLRGIEDLGHNAKDMLDKS